VDIEEMGMYDISFFFWEDYSISLSIIEVAASKVGRLISGRHLFPLSSSVPKIEFLEF